MNPEVIIIGGGVVDIPLCPVSEDVFHAGSSPLDDIRMQAGGDAVNESIILSRLGHNVSLLSLFGNDAPGEYLKKLLQENGVDTRFIGTSNEHPTGINVVLIKEDAERSFITNRKSTLRTLSIADILPFPKELCSAKIACLASTFVSPALPIPDMALLLKTLKGYGMITCADTTRPKFGETVSDMKDMLPFIDFYFPNLEEAQKLTGLNDPDSISDAFIDNGLNTIVLKLGSKGCLIKNRNMRLTIPAHPGTKCIDTTGAGDNFAAGFICALLEKKSLSECAQFANAVASVCVEHVGATTGVVNRTVVEARL